MIWYWIFALVLLDHRPLNKTKDTKDVRGKTISYSLVFNGLIYYMSLRTHLHYCIDADVCWHLVYADNSLLTDFWELVVANKHRTLRGWKMNNWLAMWRRAPLEKLIVFTLLRNCHYFMELKGLLPSSQEPPHPPLVPILNERNSVLILQSCFFKVHFNIIHIYA